MAYPKSVPAQLADLVMSAGNLRMTMLSCGRGYRPSRLASSLSGKARTPLIIIYLAFALVLSSSVRHRVLVAIAVVTQLGLQPMAQPDPAAGLCCCPQI